jgi:hypothetical protein|tara:strand:+ start:945 stop:1772 length:828 start_codon:yes stop_codon:yes gene_type:complete
LEKKLFTVLLYIFFYSSVSYTQNLNSNLIENKLYNKTFDAYKSGELLEYTLQYGFFNTSYASLEIKEEKIEEELVHRATAVGKTTGLARLFFKVDDLYEAFFPIDKVKPIKSIRDIYEGGYTRKAETYYDDNNKTATILNKITNERKIINLKNNYQDIVSTFYFLRKHLDITELNEGDLIGVNIFFDQQNYPFKMKFLGIENLKTRFGLIECMKLNPYMEAGRVFRSNKGLELWVTNDDNRIPIKVRANLRVGTITADLTSFRGIANPFKIIIND